MAEPTNGKPARKRKKKPVVVEEVDRLRIQVANLELIAAVNQETQIQQQINAELRTHQRLGELARSFQQLIESGKGRSGAQSKSDALRQELEAKYKIDLQQNAIQEDGTVAPRPPQQPQQPGGRPTAEQLRQMLQRQGQ
jgi:hypothetical protein